MDMTARTDRRQVLARGGTAAIAGAALSGMIARIATAQNATPAADGTPITAADSQTAEQNLALFDQLDFEAWNNRDWELFRQLHTEDVHVEGFGQTTDGIDAHLAWGQGFIAQVPDSTIVAHPIRIGAGDWIAVTGVSNDGSTSATIARWEDGRIAEEYLFSLMSGPVAPGS
ncbi:MAG TPA: nuclear transport factor 2 family protein [Thermomicrobiales bacterium]|jgi:hypothetical protein|nr:nuclear transport factor 2 family protein [Thermomicrobiales bacterium]